MNDEKWVSDSDMEDIAGGAGKKGPSKDSKGKTEAPGKEDPSKPGAGSGPYKGDSKGKPGFSK